MIYLYGSSRPAHYLSSLGSRSHALLEMKRSVAGIPRYYTKYYVILHELDHDFPIFV